MEDRPRLEGMRIGCRTEAATLLKQVPSDLTLEQVESLRPVLGRRKVIQRLAANHEALEQGMIQVRKQRREINQNLEKTDKALVQLPPVKDVMNLDRAVKLARKSGDIDTMIAEKKNSLGELKRSCLEELSQLGLWSGELARIGSLSIPLRETIIRFDRDFREYEDRKREILKDQKNALEEFEFLKREEQWSLQWQRRTCLALGQEDKADAIVKKLAAVKGTVGLPYVPDDLPAQKLGQVTRNR